MNQQEVFNFLDIIDLPERFRLVPINKKAFVMALLDDDMPLPKIIPDVFLPPFTEMTDLLLCMRTVDDETGEEVDNTSILLGQPEDVSLLNASEEDLIIAVASGVVQLAYYDVACHLYYNDTYLIKPNLPNGRRNITAINDLVLRDEVKNNLREISNQ